ncbi:MAG: hypothetical protein AAF226_16010 [Verrucomicrobiota bacterium]
MSSIEKIEEAVEGLSKEELRAFGEWFREYEADLWDNEIEKDLQSGKLDHLAAEALADLAEGRTSEL